MDWAAKTMEELRRKSTGFSGGKTGTEVIREFREREKVSIAVAKFYRISLLTGDKRIPENRNKFGFIKSLKEFEVVL